MATQCPKTLQVLKLKYYDLMIQFALHHASYLDAAKYFHKVWETPTIKEDTEVRGKEVRAVTACYCFRTELTSCLYTNRPSRTLSTT